MNYQKGRVSISVFASILLVILVLAGIFLFRNRQVEKVNFVGNPRAFYNDQLTIEQISTIEATGLDLPQEIIIKPGIYKIYGQNYDMTKEGLYRFILPNKENAQRIVYKENIDSLLSGLSWAISHGNLDNDLAFKKAKEKILSQKLVFTCGAAANFAKSLLLEQEIESRVVMGLTKQEFNGYDDSHQMLEVKIDDSWVLYDLDNNVRFEKFGQKINYLQMVEALKQDQLTLVKLSADTLVDLNGFTDDDTAYDYSMYTEQVIATSDALKKWYGQVLQTTFIKEGNSYFYFEGDDQKIELFEPSAQKLEKEVFLKRFYQ